MLWYKAWLETRWRFLVGLLILMLLGRQHVVDYPQLSQLLPLCRTSSSAGGRLARHA